MFDYIGIPDGVPCPAQWPGGKCHICDEKILKWDKIIHTTKNKWVHVGCSRRLSDVK